MDRRLTPANTRVAARHLEGRLDAPRFTDGTWMRVGAPVAPLFAAPGGALDRELLFGREFCVLEVRDGFAFGYARDDGYTGYVPEGALWANAPKPDHWISARQTYGKAQADLKSPMPATAFYFGSPVAVVDTTQDWRGIATPHGTLWLPRQHLLPASQALPDLVATARRFMDAPYLWGGNTSRGLDCSALVQLALWAAGIPCPGDSDLQADAVGTPLGADAALQATDLIFWEGHVGMMTGPDTFIHANAHHMAVTEEPLAPAIVRIEAAGDGPETARRRLQNS